MIPVPGARLPTKGNLSFLAYRGIKRNGEAHYHRGVDMPAPRGTPVYAAAGGTVVHRIDSYTPGFRGYGKALVVLSPGGLYYFYAHLDRIDAALGATVTEGEQLGTVGSTSYTREDPTGSFKRSGPHLHFEVSKTPYPKAAEAARLDPVAVLLRLGGKRPVRRAPSRSTAGGGGGLIILAAALAWAFSSK